jgi:hypothetical protein
MNDSSRRSFLIMSGAGAAAASVAVAVPAAAKSSEEMFKIPSGAEPMVAHISDPASGVVSLLVGEREIIVRDRDLVGRITSAVEGK